MKIDFNVSKVSRRKIKVHVDADVQIEISIPNESLKFLRMYQVHDLIREKFQDLKLRYSNSQFMWMSYEEHINNQYSKLIYEYIRISAITSKRVNQSEAVIEVITAFLETVKIVTESLNGNVEIIVQNEENIEHEASVVVESENKNNLEVHGGNSNSSDVDHESNNSNDNNDSNNFNSHFGFESQDVNDIISEVRSKIDIDEIRNEFQKLKNGKKKEIRDQMRKMKKMKKITVEKLLRKSNSPVHIGIKKVRADKSNREFYNIFKQISTEGEGNSNHVVPRWDSQKVSKSILTWKTPHQVRDRRTQSETTKGVWLCLDTSGSMGPFIDDISEIAALVSHQVPNVAVIDTPNMYFEELIFYQSEFQTLKFKTELTKVDCNDRWMLLRKLIGMDPKWIIVISDGDGYNFLTDEIYPEFPNSKFVYLDNYKCSYMEPTKRTKKELGWNPKYGIWIEYYGVGYVPDVVKVLKKTIK